MKRWFEFGRNALDGSNEVYIYGEVGWDVTGEEFSQQMRGMTGDVNVYIGSSGGSVIDGIRIYNEIKRYAGTVTTIVDTHAASIASIFALAGTKRKMEPTAFFMIHNPSNMVWGTADEMRKAADTLDMFRDALVAIYKENTNLSEKAIMADMDKETVYNSDQALAFGFVHEIIERLEPSAVASTSGYEYLRCKYNPGFKVTPVNKGTNDMNFFEKIKAALAKLQANVATDVDSLAITNLITMVDEAKAKADASSDKEVGNQAEILDALNKLTLGLPATGATSSASSAATSLPNPPTPLNAPALSVEEAVAKAIIDARNMDAERLTGIRAVFTAHPDFTGIMNVCLANPVATADTARQLILDEMSKELGPTGAGNATGGITSQEKFMEGASASMLGRVGVEEIDSANEFNSLSMIDLARNCLQNNGVNTRAMDKYSLVRNAFSHSTSDFPLLMSGVVNKILLQAYMAKEFTWRKWCSIGSVSDFKIYEQIQLGTFNNLDLIPEGGEYTAGTFGEERETYRIATKGKMISFTRQSMINDDLGGLTRVTQMMGHAAARTINKDVYQLLAANPLMANGNPIFNATDNTLAAVAGPPSIATFQAARQAMRLHKDLDDNDFLDIQPQYVLTPIVLQDSTQELLINTTNASQANANVRNPIQGMVELITDPYMDDNSATAWYFLAANTVAPLMQVSFLDGNQTPFLDSMEGFESDGIKWKVRLDYGVSPLERKGGFKNNG